MRKADNLPPSCAVVTKSGNLNPLTPNDHYSGRTALLTSKSCILYIYSNTKYFKHGVYSLCFSLQNVVFFINVTYLVSVLFTLYIKGVLKLKKQFRCQRVNFLEPSGSVHVCNGAALSFIICSQLLLNRSA